MTDRPIIFSAQMVCALVDGRKTQTRRLAWIDPAREGPAAARPSPWQRVEPGDRLWVREAFIGARGYDALPPRQWGNKPVWYVADGEPDNGGWWHLSERQRPSIHMPRWASRITLHVEAARVERLQDITEAAAISEGMTPEWPGWSLDGHSVFYAPTARETFRQLWDDLHGANAWDRNPEVVAIAFRAEACNIDAASCANG